MLHTKFLHTIFSKFAIIWYLCNVLFCVGSSIKAARSSNRHILVLEADSKLFEEVLEPCPRKLRLCPSLLIWKCLRMLLRMMKTLQQRNSCLLTYMSKSSYSICYVLIFTIHFYLSTIFLVLKICHLIVSV
jgi:hypothetical protein